MINTGMKVMIGDKLIESNDAELVGKTNWGSAGCCGSEELRKGKNGIYLIKEWDHSTCEVIDMDGDTKGCKGELISVGEAKTWICRYQHGEEQKKAMDIMRVKIDPA